MWSQVGLKEITMNKASGGDGLLVWAISNPKRWCRQSVALHMPANLENSAVATGLERSVFIPVPKQDNAKECSNYCTIVLIWHISKLRLKNLQVRLQQYMNCELSDVQAGFRKGKGTRSQIAKVCWIIGKNKKIPKKHLLLYWLC